MNFGHRYVSKEELDPAGSSGGDVLHLYSHVLQLTGHTDHLVWAPESSSTFLPFNEINEFLEAPFLCALTFKGFRNDQLRHR